MKKLYPFALILILILGAPSLLSNINIHNSELYQDFPGETIDIKGSDGLTIKADLYESDGKDDPVIILFHQAMYSRGEYRPIAPILTRLGFTCISIDQRSGNRVNGVVNETHKQAAKLGLPTKYPDAYPDLESALNYARSSYPSRKIIVWGSSYSSSLVLILASEYGDYIYGVVSFSPGEYFKFRDREIKEYAKDIDCPVFITSARNEHTDWKEIYEQIPGTKKEFYLPETKGTHGSKALWENNEGHKGYWEAVTPFLNKLKD